MPKYDASNMWVRNHIGQCCIVGSCLFHRIGWFGLGIVYLVPRGDTRATSLSRYPISDMSTCLVSCVNNKSRSCPNFFVPKSR